MLFFDNPIAGILEYNRKQKEQAKGGKDGR